MMVARCEIDQLGACKGVRRPHSVLVDVDSEHRCARADEDVPGIEVARVLHGDPVAGTEQQSGNQIEALLRADGDEDLVGFRLDPARRQQLLADHVDQHRVVGGDTVLKARVGVRLIERVAQATDPCARREAAAVDLAGQERIRVPGPVAGLLDLRDACVGLSPDSGRPIDARNSRACFRCRGIEHLGIDEHAGAFVASHVAFGDQLLIGEVDRVSGHREIDRQLPRARQPVVDVEDAAGDAMLDGPSNLPVERLGGAPIDLDESSRQPTPSDLHGSQP